MVPPELPSALSQPGSGNRLQQRWVAVESVALPSLANLRVSCSITHGLLGCAFRQKRLAPDTEMLE